MKIVKLIGISLAGLLLFAACLGSNSSTEAPNAAPPVEPPPAQSVPAPEPDLPVEPEPEPEPAPEPQETIVYTGTGDDVILIDPSDTDIWVLTIEGNKDAHHFAVKGYDEDGNYTELFVNTTEPYHGTTMDFEFATKTLEITAQGDWSITLHSFRELTWANVGDTVNGSGDSVFVTQTYGKTAYITGNKDAHHFAVKTCGATGNELLVNTTDPYEGRVLLKDEPILMIVTAEGEWQITLE